MYSILDRYIGRVVLCNVGMVLFVLVSLSSIIKFIDELRKIGRGGYGILEVGICVFLGIFRDFEIFLPMAVLLGVILGLGLFLVRNELIVMVIFGVSRLRMVCSLLQIAFLVILFGMIMSEWVIPVSECIVRNYRYKIMNNVSMRTFGDLWVKDGDSFVYIEKILQYDELLGVHIYCFNRNKNLKSVRYVASAKFVNNVWRLVNVRELCFDGMSFFVKNRYFNDVWLTTVTPYYLSMRVMSLYYFTSLSVFDLYRCIFLFRQYGQNVVQYQFRFWKKVFFPVSVVVMVLMALSCVLRSLLHRSSFGFQVVFGVIYSFFFMF